VHAWVRFIAHGDSLGEKVIGLLGVAMVKTFVEIAGLAEWIQGYNVGFRKRGLRYS
jgi:hypothetical protein